MRPASIVCVLAVLCTPFGCDSRKPAAKKAPGKSGPVVVVNDLDKAPPPAAKPAPAPEKPPARKPIIGRTTREILDLAKIGKPYVIIKPTARGGDALLLDSRAYTGPTGKMAKLSVDYCMKLYHAQHGRYPSNHKEFMAQIVKPNKLKLPARPHYQAYAYDAKNHCLVIVEFPGLKTQ